ncbi:MAG: hypothetical protein AAB770_01105 [Patescibacteria group bacterium]
MTSRKIIIISVLILGAILGGAYWYFSNRVAGPPGIGEKFPGESRTSTGKPKPAVTAEEDIDTTPVFTPGSGATLPRLYELHKLPVAGAGFIETKNKKNVTTGIAARYIERGLGYVFETSLSTLASSRIVNETRPRISEALWGNNSKSVVIRSIDEKDGNMIKTQILNIGAPIISFAKSTTTETTQSSFLKTEVIFLPNSIPFAATSEDSADKLFYLENNSDGSVGSVSTFKNSGVSKIFTSSFTEWLPQFVNERLVTINTKPSAKVAGHLFFVDTKTKSVTKILGNINGLTTQTSRDGKFVLYSETKSGRPELSVHDIAKNTPRSLSLQTLPEKCAWGRKNLSLVYCAVPQAMPSADYPDKWYQGIVSFSDDVWEINTTTLISRKIMSPKELGVSTLDIINPTLSSDDGYLLFVNKVSGTPWVYRITEAIPVKAVTSVSTATTTKTVVPPSAVTPDMKKLR